MSERIPTTNNESPDNLQSRIEAISERLHLHQQWEQQVQALNEAGVLELLPQSTDIGIVDINGKEQPIPMYEEIINYLKDNPEQLQILEQKAEQYENPKLLLVPLGMPINKLIDRYKRLLIKKDKEGKLISTDDTTLPLDKDQPIYVDDVFKGADTEGKMVYFPEEFDQINHQGKTKQELIKEHQSWQVLVIEDMDISEEGEGKTIKGRKQLSANQSPEQYLKTIQTDKQYQHEQPSTIESELTYAITKLHTENKQIDDWDGKGKACWLFGNFLKDSGGVPGFYWYRDFQRAYLRWRDSDRRDDGSGARLGVRIFHKK